MRSKVPNVERMGRWMEDANDELRKLTNDY